MIGRLTRDECSQLLLLPEAELEQWLVHYEPEDVAGLIGQLRVHVQTDATPQRIEAARRSPQEFRRILLVDDNGDPIPLQNALEPWQRADFEAADPAWMRIAGDRSQKVEVRNFYLERPRGHSKTTDIAVSAAWALFAGRHKIRGIVAASDKDQARFVRDQIETVQRLNPWIGLKTNNYQVVNEATGSDVTILASDAAGNYGSIPDFLIADELVHWHKDDNWQAVYSAVAKRRHCVTTIITNAGLGAGVSWQWKVREIARTSKDWYFNRIDGPVAPWISRQRLDEMRRTLTPSGFARLWLNQWQKTSSDYIPWEVIQNAINRPKAERARTSEFDYYVAGFDLGLTRNHSALVILGVNLSTRRYRVVYCKGWKPKDQAEKRVRFDDLEPEVMSALRRFEVDLFVYDEWQMVQMVEHIAAERPTLAFDYRSAAGKTNAAKTLMRAFNEGEIDLYDDADLIADLQKIQIEEKSGIYRVVAMDEGTEGHADRAFALVMALTEAAKAVEWHNFEAASEPDYTETSYRVGA